MENPILIQKASRKHKSAIPLFLFHDGGGTVLPYYFLESLDRNVWGVSYPHMHDGGIFENGIEEMAELYAGFVRSKIPKGKVLLGGWSAGGSISLQVAKCLESIPGIEVVGIVMIDTPFPDFPDWRGREEGPVKFLMPVTGDNTEKSRQAQETAVNDIIQALSEWQVPTFNNAGPPPTVFIRAREFVPAVKVSVEVVPTVKVPVEVDWFREKQALGWQEKYHHDLIIKELRTNGDHFSIFTAEHLPELSERLKEACGILDCPVIIPQPSQTKSMNSSVKVVDALQC